MYLGICRSCNGGHSYIGICGIICNSKNRIPEGFSGFRRICGYQKWTISDAADRRRFLNQLDSRCFDGLCDVHDALKSMVVPIPFRNGMLMPTTLGVAASGDSGMAVKQAFSILNRLRLWEIELKKNEEDIRKGNSCRRCRRTPETFTGRGRSRRRREWSIRSPMTIS